MAFILDYILDDMLDIDIDRYEYDYSDKKQRHFQLYKFFQTVLYIILSSADYFFIPYYTYKGIMMLWQEFNIWILIGCIVGCFITMINIGQNYYMLSPAYSDHKNLFYHFLGESLLGQLISSILRIRIY
jgi:hypothetical protein